MVIRDAELRDARGIAEVHIRSWQAAYVGIVPDEDLSRLSLSTPVRNYGDVFRQAVRARRLTAILARNVTVSLNSCTKLATRAAI